LTCGLQNIKPADASTEKTSTYDKPASDAQHEAQQASEKQPIEDADLQRVVDSWPQLTDADRRRILNVIRAHAGASQTPANESVECKPVEQRSLRKGTGGGQ